MWETFTSHYDKFNPENTYEISSESASFCSRYDKNFGTFFRFRDPTAVHLQNANAKFHKAFLYDKFAQDNM